jgi:hypothetical protein
MAYQKGVTRINIQGLPEHPPTAAMKFPSRYITATQSRKKTIARLGELPSAERRVVEWSDPRFRHRTIGSSHLESIIKVKNVGERQVIFDI